jgi:hypothetical protein
MEMTATTDGTMTEYSSKSAHIEDSGLFVEMAIKLLKSFGRVTYNAAWRTGYPSSMQTAVGEGIPGIERVKDITEVIDETDLFVFPDIYNGSMQLYLQDIGKRVWGGRDGDELERFRPEAKKHFKSLGLPLGPYEVVRGMDALRRHLKGRTDKVWVKISETRGDTETFSSEGYELVKNKLDQLESHLGPKAADMEFVVEDDLADTSDLAIDTYCIDGQYPDTALLGLEEKDECYVCARHTMAEMPKELRGIYETLGPTLKQYGYRGFFSAECRAGKEGIVLTDPCCRCGSPVFELELEMIANLPDILWYGAEGKVIEPKIKSRYGCELVVHSDWVRAGNPLKIEFPAKLRDKIKFRYLTEQKGEYWIMPQKDDPFVGAVVEHGNDLEAIIETCKENAAQIKGYQVENFSRAFPVALDKIKTFGKLGIKF